MFRYTWKETQRGGYLTQRVPVKAAPGDPLPPQQRGGGEEPQTGCEARRARRSRAAPAGGVRRAPHPVMRQVTRL